VVVTFGLVTAASIVVLMAVASAARSAEGKDRGAAGPPVVDEALAESVEQQVQALVADGVAEPTLRRLVGDAVRLGRGPGSA
jgi:hypothetical protein